MSFLVSGGATLKCSSGTVSSNLNVFPVNKCICAMPLANIMDNKPFVNIMPFGVCSCPGNPAVAASPSKTAPCVPNTASPWTPGMAKTMIGGSPALNDGSKLICVWGAVIEVTNAGQHKIMEQ